MGRQPAISTPQGLLSPEPEPEAELHGAAKLHCPFCTLSWAKSSDYNRHVATHNGAKPYPCKYEGCTKSFAQKTALATHWNTHTGARPHRCRKPGCNAAFGDPSSRTRHEKETHNPGNGYKCHKCGAVSKRREQFRRHYKDCFKKDPVEDQFNDARKHCERAYLDQLASGEAHDGPIPAPPKRKRRGAVVLISPSTPPEEYEEEDDMKHRDTPPRYEPTYLGELSSDSNTPNFYRDNSHLDEPVVGSSYADAFEPAYSSLVGTSYYAHPPPQYTPQDSNSPGHHFDHSVHLPPMDSPHYDARDMGDHMMGHLDSHDRVPTSDSSFSTVHSSPGHTGHYTISGSHMSSSPHLNHSPHVAASGPPLLMPAENHQAVLFDHAQDSPQLMYPPTNYRAERGAFSTSHPQLQSRQHLQQYRLHPYARDRRGVLSSGARSNAYTGSPNEAGLPMVDNSYGSQSDPDSDPMPPLSLAGVRAVRPMMESSYESTAAF
ncbi:hypothetical protein FRC07_008296 [Ceratobasidium sp. 392]|nr:hypothetical protein FRC07_008296 [Ceratobasidium sp. 392]